MRNRIQLVILLVGLSFAIAACGGSDAGTAEQAKPTVPAGAVAIVGSTPITKVEFDALYDSAVKQQVAAGQEAPKQGSAEETTLKQQVMQSLVQNAEIAQEAKAKGVKVDQKKVQEDLTAYKLQCCESKPAQYTKYLKEQGLTEEQLLAQFELRQQAQALYDDVTKNVKVTGDDAKKQYDKDKAEKYTTARSRKVAHLLLDVAPKGKATAADCTKAEEVLKLVEDGGNWKALVKQYSADPGSKDTGGEYAITDDQNWDADFRTAAFALAATGDITTPPVKSQFGCHIIKALGPIEPETVQDYKAVEQQITDGLLQEKKDAAATKWFEGVMKSYAAKTAFATGYSLPPVVPASTTTTTTG